MAQQELDLLLGHFLPFKHINILFIIQVQLYMEIWMSIH